MIIIKYSVWRFLIVVTLIGSGVKRAGGLTSSPSQTISIDGAIEGSAEIHSSFNEEGREAAAHLDVESKFLEVNVQPGLSKTAEEIVLTLSGLSEALEEEKNATEEDHTVEVEAESYEGTPTPAPDDVTHVLESPDNVTTDPTPTLRVAPEDIPSFSEWSQQQLAERKKTDPNVTDRVRIGKIRSKNYASPDCGAKIVAANAESVSASAILTSSRDEYMLNNCLYRIWFIVELCEAIQAKQIDLANFELFSSSPREFSVLLGTRFPSRDWSAVGRFTAQDSRDVQTFDLNPHLFGKYMKVEVHSHYGKEHYCPLSWVRVFGTSEYEVLATEDERHGDDDDDLTDEEAGDTPRNLFSSATDAVLSIVKKATAPFLKSQQEEPSPSPPSRCVSPRYLTVCNNCSQHTYDNVFYLLSCQQDALYQFIFTPYVKWILLQTDTCVKYGLNLMSMREGAPFPLNPVPNSEHYLTALLKESYIAALCNAMAVVDNRVVVNMSLASPLSNLTVEPSAGSPLPTISATTTCHAPDYSTTTTQDTPSSESFFQIRPTRTMRGEEAKKLVPAEVTESSLSEYITANPSGTPSAQSSSVLQPAVQSQTESLVPQNTLPKVSFVEKPEEDEGRESGEPDASLDSILKDLNELEQVVREQPAPSTSSTPPTGPPKDSIFLRLANRIKALELNMSLSSSYLEELSRRYRLQSELLGQTLNATSVRLEQQIRMEELRQRRNDEEIYGLRNQLDALTKDMKVLLAERDNWLPRPSQLTWLVIQLLVMWYYMRRRQVPQPTAELAVADRPDHEPQLVAVRGSRRRNSVECVTGHVLPVRALERRPSDEALEITVSTPYTSADRKRKKKRKDSSRKTSAVAEKRKKSDTANGFNEVEEGGGGEKVVLRQMSEPPAPVVTPNWASPAPANNTFPPEVGPGDRTRQVVMTSNRFAAFASPEPRPRLVRRFSSPAFMRTAMSARVSRATPLTGDSLTDEIKSKNNKKESGFKKYMRKLF